MRPVALADPVFLVDQLPIPGGWLLDGPEGRHAATVRRLRPGERLVLTDGVGGRAAAEVVGVERDALRLAVEPTVRLEPAEPAVTVVQALPKGDRGEAAVEMMTEAGVDTIVPWQAARCVTRWRDARGAKAWAKWRATAREAAKQSRRCWLPRVAELATTADVARAVAAADAAFVLHEEATAPLATAPLPATGSVLLVVGPEGGVAPDELAAFTAAGAVPVRLGPAVLRTSTAGVAALSVVNAGTPRWR